MKKTKILLGVILITVFIFTGCTTPASKASHNISVDADSFGVTRRITVVNMRTDKVMFEVEGTFSLSNNTSNELSIVCMIGPNQYKKHFIYLNDWTSYVMEDISGSDVDPYHYDIVIYPQLPNIELG